MRGNRNFFRKVLQSSEQIGTPLIGVSLIEIYGYKRVLVENHGGVIQYGRNEIMIRLRDGRACVSGSCLELAKMTKEQLVVIGRIESVQLCSGR